MRKDDLNIKQDMPVSFIVIDTKDKTNEELKENVASRVKSLFDRNIQEIAKDLQTNDNIDSRTHAAMTIKTYKREISRMIRQFNIQIDQIVPQDT